MTTKTKLIPLDKYDADGNLQGIDFNQEDGTFVLFAEWDPEDEQTSENRVAFRKWAYRVVSQLDNDAYEVLK